MCDDHDCRTCNKYSRNLKIITTATLKYIIRYAASFMFRTINALRMHDISALSWWTFSSIFEEQHLPTNEFGPFGANSAMQSVHGVPMPIYRGFQLLADAGDIVLTAMSGGGRKPFNQSSPLTTFATKNSTTNTMHVFLSNFAPDDDKGGTVPGAAADVTPTIRYGELANSMQQADGNVVITIDTDTDDDDSDSTVEHCSKTELNACSDTSCFIPNTDFPGGDLLPESKKFRTVNASGCCAACLAYKPDKFCQGWVWKGGHARWRRRFMIKNAFPRTANICAVVWWCDGCCGVGGCCCC